MISFYIVCIYEIITIVKTVSPSPSRVSSVPSNFLLSSPLLSPGEATDLLFFTPDLSVFYKNFYQGVTYSYYSQTPCLQIYLLKFVTRKLILAAFSKLFTDKQSGRKFELPTEVEPGSALPCFSSYNYKQVSFLWSF